MKAIVIYYSYLGNTKGIAEKIQKETGADIARIETVVPYEGDYNKVVDQGHDEVNRGYCPEIKPLDVNLADYDTVILGEHRYGGTHLPQLCIHSLRVRTGVERLFDFIAGNLQKLNILLQRYASFHCGTARIPHGHGNSG